MLTPILVLSDITAVLITGGLGVLAAWLLRRRTTLSIRHVYPMATVAASLTAAAAAARWWPELMALSAITAGPVAAALAGRRWRLGDLGAGEELRQYELARRWLWQPRLTHRPGERTYLASQGEIIRVRPGQRTSSTSPWRRPTLRARGCG